MTDTAFRIWWTRAAEMSGKSVPSKPVTFCLSPRLQTSKSDRERQQLLLYGRSTSGNLIVFVREEPLARHIRCLMR
jgi:hypothetical protein